MEIANLIRFRDAIESDLPLILDNWIDSYRTSHAAGLIAMEDWWVVMMPQVKKVLARPGVKVTVAYHPSAPVGAEVYGWVCVERGVRLMKRSRESVNGRWQDDMVESLLPLVHYVYTKEAYRRMGFAKRLFAATGIALHEPFMYTCKTGISSTIEKKLNLEAQWRPLIARFKKETS